MLNVVEQLPEGVLSADARDLHRLLPGPTLVHLPGRRPEPLFVSVLLHGNETTGLLALQRLLHGIGDRQLPRALSLFIGNVGAARQDQRRLPGQPDFNRIWSGGQAPEHRMAMQVIEDMGRRNVFAAVDVHNNTGLNPHYAIVNKIQLPDLKLASAFGRTVVYSIKPESTCSVAFSRLCPSITVECGVPGAAHGVDHVLSFVEGCLGMSSIAESPLHPQDIDLFRSVAIVKVPRNVSFSFGTHDTDIRFFPEIDHLNFREIEAGTPIAQVNADAKARLEVWNERGDNVADRFFVIDGGLIKTAVPLMPSMLTQREDIIRMDCLCYLMVRTPLSGLAGADDRGSSECEAR